MIKSPLRYIGGKSKAAAFICSKFPPVIDQYIEPFCGGISVGICAKQQRLANKYFFNDIDLNLIQFWIDIVKGIRATFVIEKLSLWHEADLDQKRKLYYEFKELLKSPRRLEESLGRRSAAYYFVNRCSFSGIGERAGFSPSACYERFTRGSIIKLKQYQSLLYECTFSSVDYSLIPVKLKDLDFIYADPPYYLKDKSVLYKDHEEFNHVELRDWLKKVPCKFILSYNDCDEIRELYSWANILPYELKYGASKDKTGKELLIANYPI